MTITSDPKKMAARLRSGLSAQGVAITHSAALELVAAQLGFRDWNTCAAACTAPVEPSVSAPAMSPTAPTTVPILRTFPGEEARRFYLDFLGFRLDWEHRFAEGMPLYQQVSREGCVLHLSEHHGDATPGSAVRIETADVRTLQRELVESPVYPLRIGLSEQPWGDDLVMPDPFGNRIVFHTARSADSSS